MRYVFCGIGGSGMLPLGLILNHAGATLGATDRSFDQGRSPEKFALIQKMGIPLYPQDGTCLHEGDTLIVSTAVEETVPDVQAARRLGCPIVTRAQLLSSLFNAAPQSLGIAGTSGKSTVTGMIGYVLKETGYDPTVMNGAVFRNYENMNPLCSAIYGAQGPFVAEVDESDRSIALFTPSIAILTNIGSDHASVPELQTLFGAFVDKAPQAVFNLDDPNSATLIQAYKGKKATFSLHNPDADFYAEDISLSPMQSTFRLHHHQITIQLPGNHNIANALCAIAALALYGISPDVSSKFLQQFLGVKRRMEWVGTTHNVTVIDDYAHNPDKLAASITALKQFKGRIIAVFQPSGFGPLRNFRKEFVQSLHTSLHDEDVLLMSEPFYAGGTVDRSVSSRHIIDDVREKGCNAQVFATRDDCIPKIISIVQPGDRIIIMGARDDTLSDYAKALFVRLQQHFTQVPSEKKA